MNWVKTKIQHTKTGGTQPKKYWEWNFSTTCKYKKKNKISARLSKLLPEEPRQGKDKLIQNKHKKIIKIKGEINEI